MTMSAPRFVAALGLQRLDSVRRLDDRLMKRPVNLRPYTLLEPAWQALCHSSESFSHLDRRYTM